MSTHQEIQDYSSGTVNPLILRGIPQIQLAPISYGTLVKSLLARSSMSEEARLCNTCFPATLGKYKLVS